MPLFEIVLTGESLPEKKPHPAPILHVLERFGLPPRQVGVIGDGWHDIRAGKAAGAVTIAVTFGVAGRAALEAEQPDFVADTVEELDRILL
jgi:phosphoglycolate phosphatase